MLPHFLFSTAAGPLVCSSCHTACALLRSLAVSRHSPVSRRGPARWGAGWGRQRAMALGHLLQSMYGLLLERCGLSEWWYIFFFLKQVDALRSSRQKRILVSLHRRYTGWIQSENCLWSGFHIWCHCFCDKACVITLTNFCMVLVDRWVSLFSYLGYIYNLAHF